MNNDNELCVCGHPKEDHIALLLHKRNTKEVLVGCSNDLDGVCECLKYRRKE